ncbi:MAG: toll/interleukin-1 receptor domain-containing protein [Saprospiraceae bacterium]
MIRIFIAYSSKDLVFKDEIRKRLRPLQRVGKVDIWDNYDIEAGKNWDAEVRDKLENSDLILLLLSPDALNSDYFYEVETPIALRRHEAGEAIAVGILLRPCDLKYCNCF